MPENREAAESNMAIQLTMVYYVYSKHRHARRARVIFFDLKAPGGCSTRWTHKGNSFMCTGVPDSSQCHYKV